MKILILEDNIEIANLTMRLLEDHGHDCYHVENGALGLERVQADDFDLIVSDVDMPTMDGLSFAVTARSKGLKAPILLFTGEPHLEPSKLDGARITAVFCKTQLKDMVKTINQMELN